MSSWPHARRLPPGPRDPVNLVRLIPPEDIGPATTSELFGPGWALGVLRHLIDPELTLTDTSLLRALPRWLMGSHGSWQLTACDQSEYGFDSDTLGFVYEASLCLPSVRLDPGSNPFPLNAFSREFTPYGALAEAWAAAADYCREHGAMFRPHDVSALTVTASVLLGEPF